MSIRYRNISRMHVISAAFFLAPSFFACADELNDQFGERWRGVGRVQLAQDQEWQRREEAMRQREAERQAQVMREQEELKRQLNQQQELVEEGLYEERFAQIWNMIGRYRLGEFVDEAGQVRSLEVVRGDKIASPEVRSQLKRGYELLQSGEYSQAWDMFVLLSSRGSTDADFYIAIMLEEGRAVRRSWPKAMAKLKRAADEGHALAQFRLAFYFLSGTRYDRGPIPDNNAAAFWLQKAADQDYPEAQYRLGVFYDTGIGPVDADPERARNWYGRAARNGHKAARQALATKDSTTKPTPAPSRNSKPPSTPIDRADGTIRERTSPKPDLHQPKQSAFGTGFYVGADKVLTNDHVVKSCSRLYVLLPNGQRGGATKMTGDQKNDLALLQSSLRSTRHAVFRSAPNIRPGDPVVLYGFPLPGALASQGNLTTGTVSALAGLRNDPRMLQISAPVQPGNSGGPVLDMNGRVVGVVVSKLNAALVAELTGDIPQNVNFAIKASVAKDFLEANTVAYSEEGGVTPSKLEPADVGIHAQGFTARIECVE